MKQRRRIYYTDSQKALMWERRRKGESLQQIAQLFVRPGKPMENTRIERISGRPHEECLNRDAFVSIDDAHERIETWRRDYNAVRQPSILGNRRPINSDSCINQNRANQPTSEWFT
ncbi:integrase core domain-containing protein [Burkholderia ubonensis]|uniref:integrase core domain-containing protein n=1 Tax=Burkholderia ubonensis TaxID=101571 RepID=UPI00076D97D5|nr:integrase core domain-containing protein [Burkholderia ubonensis]KVP14537.1 hypothetical protein WJ84_18550 [Burkholderia ubonensis]